MDVRPNHAFTDYTPNTACKGTLKMTVPALPRYMASTTNTLATTGCNSLTSIHANSYYKLCSFKIAAVGILFDGAIVYSAYGRSGFRTLTGYSNSAPYAASTSAENTLLALRQERITHTFHLLAY